MSVRRYVRRYVRGYVGGGLLGVEEVWKGGGRVVLKGCVGGVC